MKKNVFSFSLMLVMISNIFAQLTPLNNQPLNFEPCGFDQVHKELLISDPSYRLKTDEFNDFVKDFNLSSMRSGSVLRVPVVVHVMHKGEAVGVGSNISEAAINQGILQLNERFRKIAGSLGDGNGVDIEIEFALAIRDPNGNCTNGIVRFDMTGQTAYMNNGVNSDNSNGISDGALKALSRWNTTQYYNIYLVSEIDNNECGAGIQGYAYFASAHGQSYDGMIQLGCKFAQSGNTTLTHELGHALNLYHTFEGDNNGSQCPTNTTCGTQGDRVCDIPPHIRSTSNCVAGTNSCDGGSSKDLFIHNYMDYSSDACQSEFTAGQKTRAVAALTTSRASYLESNGNMSLVPPASAGVDFSASNSVICLGTPVSFYDESTCIPNTYQNGGWAGISFLWTFNNGVNAPLTSTEQNPIITFVNTGSYSVTLQVTNGHGTTSLTKPNFVTVASGSPTAACTPGSQNVGNYWQTLYNVTFNDINKTTDQYTNGVYSDFACMNSTTVIAGSSYPLSISINAEGGSGAEVFEAYIDYNNNGSFADAGELIFSGSTASGTKNTFNQNIVIPSTAVKNTLLRMRVIGELGSISANERICASSYTVGDVEDYGVYILAAGTPPVAAFSAAATTLCNGTSTIFTDASTNTPTSWAWSFTPSTVTYISSTSSTSQNPNVRFDAAGTYQVQLTATNASGSDGETKVSYITVNAAPSISTQPTNKNITEGVNTTFTVSTSNATGYQWQVNTGGGFGNVSNGGVYSNATTATLNITGATLSMNGNLYRCVVSGTCTPNATSNSVSLTVNAVGSAPVADFIANQTSLCDVSMINFTDLSTNVPTSWVWSFPGGTPSSSTFQNPSVVYNTPGIYSVTLTATNASGNSVETKVGYITFNAAPSVSIQPANSAINDGQSTSFSVIASNETGYQWQVNTGSGFNNVSNGGVYSNATTATLNINGATLAMNGYLYRCVVSGLCSPNATSNSASLTVNVGGSAPVANFSTNKTAICLGETINFTDLSSNTPTSWLWNFGDGGSSTSQNTTHNYNIPGIYTVTLTATNISGSDDTIRINLITVKALPSVLTSSTNETCAKNDGTVTATGGGTYSWNTIPIQNTATAIGLSQGNYTVTVTTNGCSAQNNVEVLLDCPGPNIRSTHCGRVLFTDKEFTNCTKVVGATQYEFQLTELGTGTQISSCIRNNSYFNLSNMSSGWLYNTTYEVSVRANVGGNWTAFGYSCLLSTPPSIVLPVIYGTHCNRTLVDDKEFTNCTQVSGATQYEFQLTELGTGIQISSCIRNGSYFNLSNMSSGWFADSTYEVSVRAYVNGSWTPFGTSCQITTPSVAMVANEAARMSYNDGDDVVQQPQTTLSIYPNPNTGEQLNVSMENLTPNSILTITDIYGKNILTKQLNTEDSDYRVNVKFDNKLSAGFYLISISSEGSTITEKLIVR